MLGRRRNLVDLRDWVKGLNSQDRQLLAWFFGFGKEKLSALANGDTRAFPDGLIKLLDWFIENGPELIALIKEIMELFMGAAAFQSLYASFA